MDYTLDFIKTEEDFFEVDTLYQSCFGVASIPTQVQYAWWKKFPQGIIGLYHNNLIIGALSYWTLNTKAFEQLSKGKLSEKEIPSSQINPLKPSGIYISEIALKKEYRHLKIAHLLMDFFHEKRPKNIPILALAYSVEGKRILEKEGFKLLLTAAQTADYQDLYLFNEFVNR